MPSVDIRNSDGLMSRLHAGRFSHGSGSSVHRSSSASAVGLSEVVAQGRQHLSCGSGSSRGSSRTLSTSPSVSALDEVQWRQEAQRRQEQQQQRLQQEASLLDESSNFRGGCSSWPNAASMGPRVSGAAAQSGRQRPGSLGGSGSEGLGRGRSSMVSRTGEVLDNVQRRREDSQLWRQQEMQQQQHWSKRGEEEEEEVHFQRQEAQQLRRRHQQHWSLQEGIDEVWDAIGPMS